MSLARRLDPSEYAYYAAIADSSCRWGYLQAFGLLHNAGMARSALKKLALQASSNAGLPFKHWRMTRGRCWSLVVRHPALASNAILGTED